MMFSYRLYSSLSNWYVCSLLLVSNCGMFLCAVLCMEMSK